MPNTLEFTLSTLPPYEWQLVVAIGIALNAGTGIALMVLQTRIVLLNVYHFKARNVMAAKTDYDSLKLSAPDLPTTNYLTRLGNRSTPELAAADTLQYRLIMTVQLSDVAISSQSLTTPPTLALS